LISNSLAETPALAFSFVNNMAAPAVWDIKPIGIEDSVKPLRYEFDTGGFIIDFQIPAKPGEPAKPIELKSKPFTEDERNLIEAAANTWNAPKPANGNVVPQNLKNAIDLQSVALHEFGHVLGLDHPNMSAETQTWSTRPT